MSSTEIPVPLDRPAARAHGEPGPEPARAPADSAHPPGPAAGAWARARRHPWAAMPILMAATFVFVLDFFIVNVALPAMQTDLGAGASAIEWVVAGYGLTLAVGLVAGGRLGDRYGRRRTFAIGLALFTLSSAACGLADSPAALIVGRLLQGLSAALMSPQILSIIRVTYGGRAQVTALSVYGMTMGLAAVGGQLIGGGLIELDVAGLGWRACFLINVPIGVAALALTPALVPESRADVRPRLDLTGTVLLALAVTAVVLPLIEGRTHGWPAWTWVSLALVPVLLAELVVHQRWVARRGGFPVLPPALFRERAFSGGLAAQMALWLGQASFFLVLALYLQQGRGLDPLEAGLVFTILAVAYLATSARAPELTARFGRRLPAVGGACLAVGHGLLAAAVADGGTQVALLGLVPGLLAVGAGMGLCITPLVATVLAHVPPDGAGAASGVLSTVQQVGGAIGVAVVGVVYFGSVDGGVGHAFQVVEILLAAVAVALVVLTRLLPGRDG